MTRNLPLFALTAAALLSGMAGVATAATTPARTTTHVAAATRTTATTHRAAPAAASRMVTAKTSTGKSITYNCSKAGNATKKACK